MTVDGAPAASVPATVPTSWSSPADSRCAEDAAFAVRVGYAGKPVARAGTTLADGGANVTGEPHAGHVLVPGERPPVGQGDLRAHRDGPGRLDGVGNGLPGPTSTSHPDSTGQAMKTFRWHEDEPLATYLSTVAIDKFTVHTSKLADGTPVINAYSPDARFDPVSEAQVPEIIEFLATKFGPYPFSSAGSIVVAGGSGSGPLDLETQSRPTYGGSMFDASVVHENAHQWFGDSVSVSDWRDGCLAECFAQYSNQLWEEHQGADLDQGFYRSTVADNKDNPDFWQVPLYDPGAGKELDPALYDKGSLMLHALRRTIGDEAFFGTLQEWLKQHRYGNASWPQFEDLAQQVSGTDLTGFFDAWVDGTTIPADRYLYPGSLGDTSS